MSTYYQQIQKLVVFWLHEAIPNDLYQFHSSRIGNLLKETSIDSMGTSMSDCPVKSRIKSFALYDMLEISK